MSRYLAPKYQPLAAYTPGEQPRDMQYVKLNTNESPYPPAPGVIRAMTEEQVSLLRLYSDPTAASLRAKLAALYGVHSENLFIANGSDEILNFAFMAFGEQGVVFPDISYGFYEVFGDLYGGRYEKIPLKEDFSLDYRDYCGIGRMVVIANPNAPTGMCISVAQIEQIVQSNLDSVVLIDEAYVDFGGESCYRLIDRYPNLLVARTYSKSRCMAGARLGYAFGSAELIADLEKIKYSTNPYNVNRLTLLLGEASVDEEAYYLEKCSAIIATRKATAERLREIGFTVLPSSANFVFAQTDAVDGEEMYQQLKKRGVLVRHFRTKRIRNFNRITIGTNEQMDCFFAAVEDILAGGRL